MQVGGREFLIPDFPPFQTWYFNTSSIFRPGWEGGGGIAHTMVQQARLSAVVPPFPQPHRMTRKGYDVGDIAVILAVTVKMAILLACVIVY